MIKIIYNLQKYLLIVLFFCLPLINSHLFNLIWIDWWFYVNWNYEFTKVIFFNIFSWIIFWLFFIQNLINKNKIKIPKILFPILLIILLSTFFSDFFYTSLLWNNSKSHSLLMFLNLIWIFVILINQTKSFQQKLIKTTLISSIFVIIIWIKEYFFPTFEYWNLSTRAFSTFWHPNYLALYILILLPLIKIKNYLWLSFIWLLFFLLILTKSVWWILIWIIYLITLIKNKKFKYYLFFILISVSILLIYNFWLITKLHSFLSRFFIWETTLKIIFSDIKNIFIWNWLWTLKYVFDWFKSPYLYIFENFWYTADRPHNLILYIFYSFWIFWIYILFKIFYNISKSYKYSKNKNQFYFHSIFLFLIFTIFNFSSISHYLIIILIWSIIYNSSNKNIKFCQKNIANFLILILSIFWFFWIYFSINYYIQEYNIKQNSNYKSNFYLYEKIKLEDYEKNLFWNNFVSIQNMCEWLISYSDSVENYFYCWNLLWNMDEELAKKYYNKWLTKLPDLRNQDSNYNKQFLIKNYVDQIRFFSDKYSNLKEIIERVKKN